MGLSLRGIITVVITALVVVGLTYLVGPWVMAGILLGFTLLAAILLLLASKTSWGNRIARNVGRKLVKTRLGKRIATAQLRSAAKRQGIPMTDPLGRPLSDFELQIELVDTPEMQALKKQLRAMNPQQRGQMIRMLERQAEEAERTGVAPPQMAPPPGFSGRPTTRPPRSRSKKKKR